jgi:altronate dehydratase
MFGEGRYDDLVADARAKAKAQGALLIILGGSQGSGFSAMVPPLAMAQIPAVLRQMADEIERDAARVVATELGKAIKTPN